MPLAKARRGQVEWLPEGAASALGAAGNCLDKTQMAYAALTQTAAGERFQLCSLQPDNFRTV